MILYLRFVQAGLFEFTFGTVMHARMLPFLQGYINEP